MAAENVSYTPLPVFEPLFVEGASKRFVVLHGGRASGKAWAVSDYLIIRAIQEPLRILCACPTRKDAPHGILSRINRSIQRLGLTKYFRADKTSIRCPATGSKFIVWGYLKDSPRIHGIEGLNIAWVEHAEQMPMKSLRSLIPVVRQEGSQIVFTINPENTTDPVFDRFLKHWWDAERDGAEFTSPEDTLIIRANWTDNPHFPEGLQRDREWDREHNPEGYRNVWLGEPKE